MGFIVHLIKKSCIALVAALLVTAYQLRHDDRILHKLAQLIQYQFQKEFRSKLYVTIDTFNIVTPRITLRDIKVHPLHGHAWRWSAKKISLKFSWWHILCTRSLDPALEIDQFDAYSTVQHNKVALYEDHLKHLLFDPPLVPLVVQAVKCSNGKIYLDYADQKLRLTSSFNSSLIKKQDDYYAKTELIDGTCVQENLVIYQALKGVIEGTISENNARTACTLQSSVTLPIFNGTSCMLTGSFKDQQGTVEVAMDKHACYLRDVTLRLLDDGIRIEGKGRIPLSLVCHDTKLNQTACLFNLQLTYAQGKIRAKSGGHLEGLPLLPTVVPHFKIEALDNELSGTLSCKHQQKEIARGSWQWHYDKKTGAIQMQATEPAPLSFKSYTTKLDRAAIAIACKQGVATGNFDIRLNEQHADKAIKLAGDIKATSDRITLQGTLNSKDFLIALGLYPHLHVAQVDYKTPLPCINLQAVTPRHIKGTVKVNLLKDIVQSLTGHSLQAEGIIDVAINTENPWSCDLTFSRGAIRVPNTYNLIHHASATLTGDLFTGDIRCKNVTCNLHKGTVACKEGRLLFDPSSFDLKSAHLPLIAQSCLLTLDKNLFAILSGQCTCAYQKGQKPLLTGNIIIDHAHVQQNIFSQAFQRNLFAMSTLKESVVPDIACDITIETMRPVNIKTAFLETAAKVTMHIGNSLQNPEVTGSISLISGNLFFPYKPLTIEKAHLFFNPHQLYDPHVELMARNTIKKHVVTMQISGSISDPLVMLESRPSLTEEQIIGLMFAGTERDSLNMIIPALVMQNIKHLVFNDDHSQRTVDHYIHALLKPFKNIQLVPSFIDQTGRGGLRGAIEIGVNDRLHATIQKNFNLTEDTRFELEYLLSDNVSLKAFRDERRDAGGEVEMRWKL